MKIILLRCAARQSPNNQIPENLDRIQGLTAPLGLTYIGAVLEKAGYPVKIIDAMAEGLSLPALKNALIVEKPDLVGITMMTTEIPAVLKAARVVKDVGAKVVVGGPQLSVYPKETVMHECIDFGIIGEGELALANLVQALEGEKTVGAIEGLVYKQDGKIIANKPVIVKNVDELPLPSRHLLQMERYFSIIGKGRTATMISSRGCPFNCGFCSNPPFMRVYRARSPVHVVNEMQMLVENYKVNEIMFYDDCFTLRRDHVLGVCHEILDRGLKVSWETPTRLDCVDRDMLHLMHRAGCIRLRYGVESADENILDLMNKKISLSQVEKIFQWTREAGIKIFAYFVIGYIDETASTMKKTISFARKLRPDGVVFSVGTPYPGTNLYDLARERGIVRRDYWLDFTLGKSVGRLPYCVPDAGIWLKKAYRCFYLDPVYIARKLVEIRTWQDLRNSLTAVKGVLFPGRVT